MASLSIERGGYNYTRIPGLEKAQRAGTSMQDGQTARVSFARARNCAWIPLKNEKLNITIIESIVYDSERQNNQQPSLSVGQMVTKMICGFVGLGN
jgi:hypothetical protein